jgi:hypothetical protein
MYQPKCNIGFTSSYTKPTKQYAYGVLHACPDFEEKDSSHREGDLVKRPYKAVTGAIFASEAHKQ